MPRKPKQFTRLTPEQCSELLATRSIQFYNDGGRVYRQYPTQDGYLLEDRRFWPHGKGEAGTPMGNRGADFAHRSVVSSHAEINNFEIQITPELIELLCGIPASQWRKLTPDELTHIESLLEPLIPHFDELFKARVQRQYDALPSGLTTYPTRIYDE